MVDHRPSPHVLREYALLADGHRGALVGPRGDVAWLCAPRWHDDAVFSELIGGSGTFTITPSSRFVWGGHYERAGLIWRSRWVTDDGITECREALAYPGDPHRLILLRRIMAVRDATDVAVQLFPAARFGAEGMRDLHQTTGGRWCAEAGSLRVRVTGLPHARFRDGEGLRADISLAEGAHHDIVVEISDRALPPPPDVDNLWSGTENAWQTAVPEMNGGIAVDDTRQSYAVLRGMTAPGGGLAAAATLGLPERARAGRDYDYRYVWIRDLCYAGMAVAVAEPLPLLDEAVAFVTARLLDDGPDLRPAYTVDGENLPAEQALNLPGYPGGADIVGNHAGKQFQLDAFGEALQLLAAAARFGHLDTPGYRAMSIAVRAIAQRWRDPDAGIWELEQQRWAQSRLACVGGLRSAAACATRTDGAEWNVLADAILADTADCGHPSGRWQRAPADSRVDAALLLPALRGAVPADHPRTRATVAAVADDLARDFFVYRFHHDGRPLHEAEGAFALCGFLMAQAAHQRGDVVSAVRYFERNRTACGPPGLLSEEYDVIQRQMRGNLPQAFVHALLIESSLTLADSRAGNSALAGGRRQ
ncbi:glycoside hydrolase family 15 protein [Mycolicibacterium sp. 3033]|nr:glycoside hydrolase family 15 protein [Mycolicibacterium aurantiacum]